MTIWYLKNWEIDKDLPLAHDEYLVCVEGGRSLQLEIGVAEENFHEWWVDDSRDEIVVGRRPSTKEAFRRIAVATDRDVAEMEWVDWARRNPMEARQILDLPEKLRRVEGHEHPGLFQEPSWWPLAYEDDGTKLGRREYLIQANDDFRNEPFGYCSDACAASAHFSHWEVRVSPDFFHHVVARGPVTRAAKYMCKNADRDRPKKETEDIRSRLTRLGLLEEGVATQSARALMEALEEAGAFLPGEATGALESLASLD
jgi:hypothetical protein